MPNVCVTLSANAGVSVAINDYKVWVDALYGNAEKPFSSMDETLAQRVLHSEEFANPGYICYTHCHADHFCKDLTEEAMRIWPEAKVFLPQQELKKQTLVQGEVYQFSDKALTIQFLKLPHEGRQYQTVKHYGLLLQLPGCNILLPGDCEIAAPALEHAIKDMKIHVAVLDFPWITLKKGQAFIKDVIKAEHILAYHLPFEEDDTNHYRDSARKAAAILAQTTDVRLLQHPMQTEQIII